LSGVISNKEVIDQLRGIHVALQERDARRAGQPLEAHVQSFIDDSKMQLL
jgi:hypothetical protein